MKRLLLLTTYHLLLITLAVAQPGALDMSFDPHGGANQPIHAVAIQNDGKIIIGGEFDIYGGAAVDYITRLNTDGSRDTSFATGENANYFVYALAIQADGKIVVGGQFNTFDTIPSRSIARLNADGTLDTTFHTGTGFNERVKSLYLQTDGKILAGGYFTGYNGTTCGRIMRLNTDGTADTSFHSLSGADGSVEAIAVHPDGRIVIGGDFDHYNGDLVIRATRLNADGTRDTSFHVSGHPSIIGVDAVVNDIAIDPLNKILLGGYFNQVAMQTRRKVARLLPGGDFDGNYNFQGDGCNSNSEVWSIELLPDGKLLFGGTFTSYDTIPINRIGRLNANGELDTDFNPGGGPLGAVNDLGVQRNEKIIVAGGFLTYDGISRNKIARLYNCLTAQPDSIYGLGYAACSGAQQTFYVNALSGAESYEWTLPNGWTGSSDSARITATSNGSGGTISVRAFSDSCGYSYATTRNIVTIQPPGVDICLVTVDSQSTHNIIMWEKPITNLIDSFFIYREITSNNYSKIAAVPYDSLSEYHDYAANPNTTSYRYKLSVLDTCGAESALSPFHSTIHLQNLGNGNFQWTFYQIEPGINPVTSFNVYRDDLGNGNFSQIGFVPGTNATFTDINFNSFPNSIYVVDVNWGISCSPSRAVNTTRSNIRHRGMIDTIGIVNGIQDDILADVRIYPNPAKDVVHVVRDLEISEVLLINSLGEVVLHQSRITNEIDVSELPGGLYTAVIATAKEKIYRKLLIE